MKKITFLLAVIGMISLSSCTINEDNTPDNDTISEVLEYRNVNFQPNSYAVVLNFPRAIFSSDMVLVYRLTGVFQGNPIWKLLPETYYFNDGTLDFRFDYDFTRFDAEIRLEGYDLAGLSSNIRLNQTFRVVIVPGYFGNRMSAENDFSDYNKTIEMFNIEKTKIKVIEQNK